MWSNIWRVEITVFLPLAVLLACALLSAWATGRVRRYALSRSLLDLPNERSSHRVPTPRGGGVVIAVVWVVCIPLLWSVGALGAREAVGLWGGGIAVAGAGWWDDHVDLRARTRLIIQVLAAVWTVAWIGGFPVLDIGALGIPLGIWGVPLAALVLVWLSNLYNFMDGIDGLSACEAITVGVTVGIILWQAGAEGLAFTCLLLAASSAGFLVWNWPPATIFMGDVGSALLGYAFGSIAFAAEQTSGVPALLLLLPLGVFICDATITLLRRLLQGERIYQAHRSHLYQRLVQNGWSHRRVTVLVLGVNLGLAAVAWLLYRRPSLLPWGLLAVAGGLTALGWGALSVSAHRSRRAAGSIRSGSA